MCRICETKMMFNSSAYTDDDESLTVIGLLKVCAAEWKLKNLHCGASSQTNIPCSCGCGNDSHYLLTNIHNDKSLHISRTCAKFRRNVYETNFAKKHGHCGLSGYGYSNQQMVKLCIQ